MRINGQRLGQVQMNALPNHLYVFATTDPHLDAFYDDEKLPALRAWVELVKDVDPDKLTETELDAKLSAARDLIIKERYT